MKKLLLILVALLWCNVGVANSSLPKCTGSDDSKYTNCYGEYSNKILAPGYTRTFKGEYGNIPGEREGQGSSTIYKDEKIVQRVMKYITSEYNVLDFWIHMEIERIEQLL